MYRFVWDLRYPDPPAVHTQSPYNYPIAAIVGATPLLPQGALVMPGKYEVRLSVSGQTYRKSFEVKMDPRVSIARNALQSALQLQLKISDALGRNFAAYRQVKGLRTRLAELTKQPCRDAVAAAAAAVATEAADPAADTVG